MSGKTKIIHLKLSITRLFKSLLSCNTEIVFPKKMLNLLTFNLSGTFLTYLNLCLIKKTLIT